MTDDPRRAALGAAQSGLLAALVAGAPPPPGFDAARVHQQAQALLAKRALTVSAHHPWLTEALGDAYSTHFHAYAAGRPRAAGTTSHEDAAAFETYLRDIEAMPSRRAPRFFPRRRRA